MYLYTLIFPRVPDPLRVSERCEEVIRNLGLDTIHVIKAATDFFYEFAQSCPDRILQPNELLLRDLLVQGKNYELQDAIYSAHMEKATFIPDNIAIPALVEYAVTMYRHLIPLLIQQMHQLNIRIDMSQIAGLWVRDHGIVVRIQKYDRPLTHHYFDHGESTLRSALYQLA